VTFAVAGDMVAIGGELLPRAWLMTKQSGDSKEWRANHLVLLSKAFWDADMILDVLC
jgi:hypothetical protein